MKIGLTYTGSPEKHQNYVNWLIGNERMQGKEPGAGKDDIEVIKLSVDGDPGAIRDCDALVLSGGVDIHPEMYGGGLQYPKWENAGGWKKDRDVFERSAFEFALERGMPVLGVCRGMQLINTSFNGTLIQDLGEKGDETHENAKGRDKQHPVRIEEGSLLHAIAGRTGGEVNSAHHQAIDKLGEGLQVNSRAEDGTIEGIEWNDPSGKPFMIAVQWHPERMFMGKLADLFLYKNIRDRFIAEIKQRQS